MPDVQATYDQIAEHFSATRAHPWPEVEDFLADRRARVGLDLGCANGRHAELLAQHAERVLGLDLSRALLDVARSRARDNGYAPTLDLVQADAEGLPLADATVDLAVYVAALHHLRPGAARLRSLDELGRVLAPGGRGLVSVWSVTHEKFDAEEGFDTTVDWTLPDGETVPRYYHIYDPAEFRADLDASTLAVEETWEASGNCWAVVGPERS